MYLLWFDDSRKPTAQKITAGCEAYRERFHAAPTQVLVNEIDMAVVDGIQVEARATVRPNTFWVGMLVEEGRR